MSYILSAQVIGSKELDDAFKKAPTIVSSSLKKAIGKAAFIVESKVKGYAPIQYGTLRGSINVRGPYITSSNVEAIVGTNVKYAPYQEYGTGIYAGKGMIVPKKARVLAWRGRDGSWRFAKAVRGVQGKRFFQKAVHDAKGQLAGFLQKALSDIISALAKS